MESNLTGVLRFGDFELDLTREELRRSGRRIKLQPQPFKVLVLLASRAGKQVSRDEIRTHVWPDGTYVDFDQGVNFCIKQVRDALGDPADRPVYVETLPRRGYRFMVPVAVQAAGTPTSLADRTTMRLQKILWTNLAELRVAERRRKRYAAVGFAVVVALLATVVLLLILR